MVSADNLVVALNSLTSDTPVANLLLEQVVASLDAVATALGNGSQQERIFKEIIAMIVSKMNGGENG